ncbi:MAG TPA: MlaD family protein [Candidatus Hydrothermia bacterium]|nr:MlaD family protein [Candidatus Hydrothermia bacterium]MDD5572972.1 MlaD family protein [Candidatus Hydrothermia bacterium]HOP32375.1 MlaD family protein [Candidatus Hydrothermia bacterium]
MSVEEKVGIAVTLLILLLVGGIFLSRDFAVRKNRINYEVVFENPVSLKKGDPVAVLGVTMGKVSEISIEDSKVIVEFYTEKYPLSEGSRIIMDASNVLGQVRLMIIPGDGVEVKPGTRFLGEETRSLEDLVAGFVDFSDTLMVFLKRVDQVISELKPLSVKVESTIDVLEKSIEELKDTAVSIASTQNENLTILVKKLNVTLMELDSTLYSVRNHPLMRDDSVYIKVGALLDDLGKISRELEEGVEIKARLKLF